MSRHRNKSIRHQGFVCLVLFFGSPFPAPFKTTWNVIGFQYEIWVAELKRSRNHKYISGCACFEKLLSANANPSRRTTICLDENVRYDKKILNSESDYRSERVSRGKIFSTLTSFRVRLSQRNINRLGDVIECHTNTECLPGIDITLFIKIIFFFVYIFNTT